jgi:hypothetical protein
LLALTSGKIDIVRYNTSQQQWVLVQTVTDVVRGHGHTQDVKYQSMTFSSDGERLIFADGHGVNVYLVHHIEIAILVFIKSLRHRHHPNGI